MSKFIEKEKFYGFDPSESWQMIPLGGVRNVILEDGANLKIKLKDLQMNDLSPSVATFYELTSPGQSRREFCIFGNQSGDCLLRAWDTRSSKRVTLKISILPIKIIKVDFYRLCDQKDWSCGVRSPYRKVSRAQYPVLIDRVNKFLFDQTNIVVHNQDRYHLDVNYDFGDEIDADTLMTELNNRFSWDASCPSVILVWKFEKSGEEYKKGNELAFTKPPFVILEDDANDLTSMAHTLAHEICHYFIGPAHEGDENNLMYYKNPHGGLLNRVQITELHKQQIAWW